MTTEDWMIELTEEERDHIKKYVNTPQMFKAMREFQIAEKAQGEPYCAMCEQIAVKLGIEQSSTKILIDIKGTAFTDLRARLRLLKEN